jgi:hypothetical protein
MAFFSHDGGTRLAQSNAVSGTSTYEDHTIAGVGNLVSIAADLGPSELSAHSQTEAFSRYVRRRVTA